MIRITKHEDCFKLYLSRYDIPAPGVIVFFESKSMIVTDMIIDTIDMAQDLASAIGLGGVIVDSLQTAEEDRKKPKYDIIYFDESTLTSETRKISPMKVIEFFETDKIVTYRERHKIKRKFNRFYYKGENIYITFKPVVW